jgi:hypothetical protein
VKRGARIVHGDKELDLATQAGVINAVKQEKLNQAAYNEFVDRHTGTSSRPMNKKGWI